MSFFKRSMVNIGSIDSAWGSSGKGKFNAHLALKETPDFAISSNSAQASHVVVFDDEDLKNTRLKYNEYKFNHLPVSVVSPSVKNTFLTGACVINLPKLLEEIEAVNLTPHELHIHPNAVIISESDVQVERERLAGIASTMSGIAPAMCRKIMRNDYNLANNCEDLKDYVKSDFYERLSRSLRKDETGILETAQGFGLSIDHGFYKKNSKDFSPYYPYTTSRNVDPLSFAGSAGIPRGKVGNIFMNMRTYPIRVGDKSTGSGIDERSGAKLGSSGAYWYDQKELSWPELSAMLGMDVEEKTSLTRRVRRVFTTSPEQVAFESGIIDPDYIFINFVNYLDKNIAGVNGVIDFEDLNAWPAVFNFVCMINDITQKSTYNSKNWGKVRLLGTGRFNHEVITIDYL